MDLYTMPLPGAGGKTCAQVFEEAGCDTPTSPSCGACLGGPRDTYARLNEPQVSYCGFTEVSIMSLLAFNSRYLNDEISSPISPFHVCVFVVYL
jgi:hypothetical protein